MTQVFYILFFVYIFKIPVTFQFGPATLEWLLVCIWLLAPTLERAECRDLVIFIREQGERVFHSIS